MTSPIYIYAGRVDRVVDGDTLVVTIDLGFRVSTKQHIRVRGVNTAEMNTPEGIRTRSSVSTLFLHRPKVLVQTYRDQQTFARWVADVYLDDGVSFADWLRTQQLVSA